MEAHTHSIHIPGSPYNRGKYVLHEKKTEKRSSSVREEEAMCISMCTQIVYGILMFACLGLTVASLLTPGWRNIDKNLQSTLQTLKLPSSQGILPLACKTDGPPASQNGDYCEQWWKNLQTWEKVVIGLMIAAVAAEIAALAWNAFTWCACCCKKYVIHVLTPLSILVAGLLCAAVITFGVNNQNFFSNIKGFENFMVNKDTKTEVGYSYWMAIAALILATIDIVIAVVSVFFGERCC